MKISLMRTGLRTIPQAAEFFSDHMSAKLPYNISYRISSQLNPQLMLQYLLSKKRTNP
jgi:hypothetical protein